MEQISVGDVKMNISASGMQQFETGAVRDSVEGKGQPSLISPFIIKAFAKLNDKERNVVQMLAVENGIFNTIYHLITNYQINGTGLESAMYACALLIEEKMTGVFPSTKEIIPVNALIELSKWYELGAVKYEAHNWDKGMPADRCLDSFYRHLAKANAEWIDEPHDVACLWNVGAIIHYHCTQPELCNIYWQKYKGVE